MKKKWANCFFNTGQLRLGTLFDYAKNKSYGNAVHDRSEGYFACRVPKEECVDGAPEVRLILARNNLLLCSSTDYDKNYYDKFDADCSIRIDSMAFFTAIDTALHINFTRLLLRKVIYYDKSRWDCIRNYVDFAGVMKDSSFSYQHEVRALWEPKKSRARYVSYKSSAEYFKNSPLDFSKSELYQQHVKEECKWLKPKTIFVPDAIEHCALI